MSNYDYSEYIELGLLGELRIEVNYDYSPKEEPCLDVDSCPQAGSEESVSINAIICPVLNNADIDELITGFDRLELEQRILGENHGEDGYGWNGNEQET